MESVILITIAFITSSISAILGMGGGIILLGSMPIVIPEGYIVVALHGVIQLVSNVTRSYVFRKHIKGKIIFLFSSESHSLVKFLSYTKANAKRSVINRQWKWLRPF